jgi:hypothetical protein
VDAKPVHFRGGRWPDAVEFSDRQRLDEGRPISGVITNMPSGLRWSEASFARNLL